MKQLEKILSKVDGFLISIERDTQNGFYILKAGLPPKWKFESKNDIECEAIIDTEEGILLNIYPNSETVVIDDLVDFLVKIIKFNEEFQKKEEEFNDEIANEKERLEKRIQGFYDGLNSFKENFFSEKTDNKKIDNIISKSDDE